MAYIKGLIRRELAKRRKSRYGVKPSDLDPSFGEMGLFDQALDILARPGRVVTGAVRALSQGRDPLEAAFQNLTRDRKDTYSDILQDMGMKPGLARSALGLAGDIALDPLSFVGIGPVAKAGAATVKGVSKALTKAGVAKVSQVSGRLERGLRGAISKMPDAKLVSVAERAARQAPEARALLRGLKPAELRSEAGIKALTKGLSAPHVGRALEKTPGLVAANAIKFAGLPLVKTATIEKIAKGALGVAKAVPIVGRGVQAVERAVQKGAGAVRKVFSTKTGISEVDAAVMAARDRRSLWTGEAGKFAEEVVGDISKIARPRTPGYKAAQEEIVKTIEGVNQKAVVGGVLTETRVPYVPKDPRIAAIAEKIKSRLAGILEKEKGAINLPPDAKSFYLPHYLKPEIEKAIRENPTAILRTTSPAVSNTLRRTNKKGVLELTLDDMIEGGVVDPDKLEKILKEKGLPPLSATDRLVFESDPVVAALRREVSSVRAVAASEMRDDLIHSPSFLKSKVNLLDEGDIAKADAIVGQHPDHAIYVTTRDYIDNFLTDAQRENIRRGGNRELLKSMMVKIDDQEQLAKLAGKSGRVEGYVLPDEIVKHLNAAHIRDFTDERLWDFVRNVYDPMLGWWKAFTTIVRPGFTSRNIISNIWQNFLAGVKDPTVYAYALQLQRAAKTGKWGKLAGIGGLTDREIYKLASEMGMVRTGQLGQGVERFVEQVARPSRNPLSTSGPWVKLGGDAAGFAEDNAKLANFIDGLKKGMDPRSASMRAKKYLFDYTDLSTFEKTVLKRLAPFYTFTRKNIPLQLGALLKQPGKVVALGKIQTAADKDVEALDRPVVADWINKSLGVPIKKNADGTVSYVLMGGIIPTADLARMDTKQLVSMLSPIIKAPIEQLMNEDWFRARPIANFPGEMVQFMGIPMPARLAHLVRNLVIVAQIDRGFFQDDRDFVQGLSNLILGIRAYKQDPVRQLKSYFLRHQKEAGMLENQAARQAGKASIFGDTVIRDQLLARAEKLHGRAMTAKAKALDLNPLTFQRPKTTKPEMPQTMAQVIARMRAQARKKAQ